MSEVKNNSNAKVWVPPVFPVEGRLPGDVVAVTANYKKQIAEEVCHQRGVDSKGQSLGFECCHSLHISLFFDGTNNNEINDTKKSHPRGCMGKLPVGTFPMQPEMKQGSDR
ncbi:hypothetical protein [Pseudomonas fluorescens]|uniref:hypothetical protein n=1 Tax=Pseudomonas fluorescens TaxID=294 RepID=UPI0021ACC2D4|nr:hypothetical protein [Pseudomonas fluorescens]